MRASFLSNLSKTKKSDIVIQFDDFIDGEINPRMYWPLDETTGTVFSDSGDGLNNLQSVADASDFNIVSSTPHITGANQAKQIDGLTNHSLNVIGNDTNAGTLYNSFDALLFQIKRSVDPQVDTTVLSYTNNGVVEQYKIVSGSSVVMTIKNGSGNLVDLTIIPDTNFMLDEWAFYAIVYDGFRGFFVYVNGILRSQFDVSLFGGVGGNFKVGGDISPLTSAIDLALDNILVVGDRISELEVREAYSVWKFGYSSQDEVWVGENSEQNAISAPESSHIVGGLSTRTVIGKDQKFVAYKVVGTANSSIEIIIIEGTAGYSNKLNMYIYSGLVGGAYTLQETHLKINVPDSNNFTDDNYIFNYTLPAVGSEAFIVFEVKGSSSHKPIQFQTFSAIIDSFSSIVADLSPVNWLRFNESQTNVREILDEGSLAETFTQSNVLTAIQDAPSSIYTGASASSILIDDALEEFLQVPPANNFNMPSSATIEFAWNPTAGISNSNIIGVTTDYPNALDFWAITRTEAPMDDPKLNLVGDNTPPGESVELCANLDPFIGGWCYVSITVNSATNTYDCRINDIQQGNVINANLSFGAVVSGSLFFFGDNNAPNINGYDEFQIYDKVLTGLERTRNYNYWFTGSP